MPTRSRKSVSVIRPASQVLAQALDLDLLRLAEFDAGGVDALCPAGERLNLLGVGGELALRPVPDAPVLVVKVVDRVVENLLDEAVGAPLHVDPAADLEENPGDVLPALLRVCVPTVLLEVDGLEARLEDREEHRTPGGSSSSLWASKIGRRISPLRIGGRVVPHEGDDFRPVLNCRRKSSFL